MEGIRILPRGSRILPGRRVIRRLRLCPVLVPAPRFLSVSSFRGLMRTLAGAAVRIVLVRRRRCFVGLEFCAAAASSAVSAFVLWSPQQGFSNRCQEGRPDLATFAVDAEGGQIGQIGRGGRGVRISPPIGAN